MLPANSYISLQIRLFKEEGEYVAICDDLGLASCGSGLEEAKKRINNAITLVLNAATQNGEIEAFLREKEVKVYTEPPTYTITRTRLRSDEWLSRLAVPLGGLQRVAI